VYIYIYLYIDMYVCIYLYTYKHVYIHIHIYKYRFIHADLRRLTYGGVHIGIPFYSGPPVDIYIHLCTDLYMYINTQKIHIHIRIYI